MCFLGYNNSFALMCSIYSTQHTQFVGQTLALGYWAGLCLGLDWSGSLMVPTRWYHHCSDFPTHHVSRHRSSFQRNRVHIYLAMSVFRSDLPTSPMRWVGLLFPSLQMEKLRHSKVSCPRVTQDVLELIVHMQMALHHHPLLTAFNNVFQAKHNFIHDELSYF